MAIDEATRDDLLREKAIKRLKKRRDFSKQIQREMERFRRSG